MTDNLHPSRPTSEERVWSAAATIASLAPIVGGPVCDTINKVIDSRQNRRLEGFVRDVHEDLTRLTRRVNGEFLRTEHALDLAEHVFDVAMRTRQREKLDAIRGIFLHTLTSDTPDYDEAAEILDLVGRWQRRHVVLLAVLGNSRRAYDDVRPRPSHSGHRPSVASMLKAILPAWDSDTVRWTLEDLGRDRIHKIDNIDAFLGAIGEGQLERRLTRFGSRVVSSMRTPS